MVCQIGRLKAHEALAALVEAFPAQVTFSTSFSLEDQVITDIIHSNHLPVTIFTLDTGRLFPETYAVWNSTIEKYKQDIKVFYPKAELIEPFMQATGPNSFYASVENRKMCCNIRKVEPLQRALAGNKVWVTGMRAEHSAARHDLRPVEWDEVNQVIKYHPLLHWSTQEVAAHIATYNIPYNPLHDRGFVSIGCAPCTRAIKPGEDFRAGRWWWEDASKKECGLHVQQPATQHS
ncbi:MAG: phosphoadenylyl-sulfate reductase [Chitinophagaceae bacterium]|nr:MAG: phosphoadenylyl-sulfate reductase [Chitinophagaceae bacterium]